MADIYCVECGKDAEGATCDDCGDPFCVECIMRRGVALCIACDDGLDDDEETE